MGTLDGQVQPLGEVGNCPYMVQVAMGNQDLRGLDRHFRERREDAPQIAPRVDHGGVTGLVAPEDGTVLLKRGDGNNLELKHLLSLRVLLAEFARWAWPRGRWVEPGSDQLSRNIS
jgi:hypothetical protein